MVKPNPNTISSPRSIECHKCGTTISGNLLVCPGCNALLYSDRLKELAMAAASAEEQDDLHESLALWREALTLLPDKSTQYSIIIDKVEKISRTIEQNPEHYTKVRDEKKEDKKWFGKGVGLGVIGLFLFKFKFLFIALLTKGKLLPKSPIKKN